MKRLFIVRHGETAFNSKGIWAGQVETKLTDKGKNQAKLAGLHIKDNLPQFDLLISSPYSRALDTASIIATELDYPINKIVHNELFIERSYGKLEGKSNQVFFDKHEFKDIDEVEGAETVKQMHDRAMKALEYLKTRTENNILVISHGTFGRALYRVVKEMPHTHEYLDHHRAKYRMANAEIVELI
jgi:broad specificity phosphatase PhoE